MLRTAASFSKRASCLLVAGLSLALPAPFIAQQTGLPRSQRHESRHEIDQLEESWREAELKSNTAAMDALLADDYMAVTPSGTLQTKEQALSNIRSGLTHFNTLALSERKVRFYGATAVVNSIAQVDGVTPDGNVTGSYRYTRVYVRDLHGKWKIVSFEASRIREPGEHR
jgi:ketosteroid isomerase-like protein